MIISKAKDCNITKFMACLFEGRYDVLSDGKADKIALEDAWDNLYTEYLDAAGIKINELILLRQIKSLECRNQAVSAYLFTNETTIELLKEPFMDAWPHLARNGHKFTWNNDVEDFKLQLKKARTKEKRYEVELNMRKKELNDYLKAQEKTPSIDNSRTAFLRLIQNLSKYAGYPINKDLTTVEELAIMIKDYNEIALKDIEKKN